MLSDEQHAQTLGDNTTVNANVGHMEDNITTTLLTNCLNCNTHSKEFNEECIGTDAYLYECPNCGETYDGEDLSEEA